jgi:hypothetical protein
MAASSDRGRDRDANSAVGALRRHGDVVRGVRSGELVFERESGGAGDARGRHGRQCDRRDAHLRSGEHNLGPVRGGPGGGTIPAHAQASAGGIEQHPGVGTVRRGRGGEQDAQHRHDGDPGARPSP